MDGLIAGRIDADLGSAIYKQRLARQGGGKSGGFRTIIVFRYASAAFFVYGFAKKDIDNVSLEDLQELKKLARSLLMLSDSEIDYAVEERKLFEVKCGEKV